MNPKDKIIEIIDANGGCKLKHILKILGLDTKPEGEEFSLWYENSYRLVDRVLQELKREGKIEYRRGKGGGWYLL